MTVFDTAWEQAQGFGCRICDKPQYNDSGLCTQCSRMEQELHESGAYQRRKAPDLNEVIHRLILEERDEKQKWIKRSAYTLNRPYEVGCRYCGKTKRTRTKLPAHSCCGERMQEV